MRVRKQILHARATCRKQARSCSRQSHAMAEPLPPQYPSPARFKLHFRSVCIPPECTNRPYNKYALIVTARIPLFGAQETMHKATNGSSKQGPPGGIQWMNLVPGVQISTGGYGRASLASTRTRPTGFSLSKCYWKEINEISKLQY